MYFSTRWIQNQRTNRFSTDLSRKISQHLTIETSRFLWKYYSNQRWAGMKFWCPAGPSRGSCKPAPPHPAVNFSKCNSRPPVPVHSAPRPARPRVGRLSAPPRPPVNFATGPAPPRPRTPENFFIHHLIYFEWFIIHNWLIYYKKNMGQSSSLALWMNRSRSNHDVINCGWIHISSTLWLRCDDTDWRGNLSRCAPHISMIFCP
jgi:hypothetical protein